MTTDPFNDPEDKENAPARINTTPKTGHRSNAAEIGPFDRMSKEQSGKPVNPFTAKLLQNKGTNGTRPSSSKVANNNATGNGEKAEEMSAARIADERKSAPQSKDKTLSQVQPKAEAKKISDNVKAPGLPRASLSPDPSGPATLLSGPMSQSRASPLESEQRQSAQEQNPARSVPSSPASDLERDCSVAEDDHETLAAIVETQPKASTPTSNRTHSSRSSRARLSEEVLLPIADPTESEEEAAADLFEEHPKAAAMHQHPGASASSQMNSSRTTRRDDSEIENPPIAPMAAWTVAPKAKRTLASFGGSKKSINPAVAQAAAVTTTPATSGFKSSFLTKSLRQASERKAGDEDDLDEADSILQSGSTKANTQANAMAVLQSRDGELPTRSTEGADRSAGAKRKSDALGDDSVHQRTAKRLSAGPTSKDLPDASQKQSTAASSKAGPSANLLRSKLENARLQKSANPGSVGLGARGLTSPLLRASGFGSTPTSPDLATSKSYFGSRAQVPQSNGNVAQLLNTWEARNSSVPSSPRKSNGAASTRNSPSRLPVPVSTTPQASPVRRLQEKTPAPAARAVSESDAIVSKAMQPKTQPDLTKARTDLGNKIDEESDQSDSSASVVTANATAKFEEGGETSQQTTSSRARSTAKAQPQKSPIDEERPEAALSSPKDDDEHVGDEGDHQAVDRVTKAKPDAPGRPQPSTQTEAIVEESLDLRKSMPDASGDASSFLQAGLPFDTAEKLPKEKSPSTTSATSAATQILPTPKAISSTSIQTAPNMSDTGLSSANTATGAGASGWSSRLKGLFGIAGMPTVANAGPPPPGTGFQPKMSRTVSNAGNAAREGSRESLQSQTGAYRGTSNAKPASLIRAEQVRRKEAEEAEKRAKEAEAKKKLGPTAKASVSSLSQKAKADGALTESGKRLREETGVSKASEAQTSSARAQTASQSTMSAPSSTQQRARIVSHVPAGSKTNGGNSAKATTTNHSDALEVNGKKRRLTPEKEKSSQTSSVPSSTKTIKGSTIKPTSQTTVARSATVASATAAVRPTAKAAAASATAASSQVRAPTTASAGAKVAAQTTGNTNFTQQNPFQQARSIAAAAQPPPQSHRPPPPSGGTSHSRPPLSAAALASVAIAASGTGTVLPNVEDDNVSLPSIVSEYSDSEDEETQARRARAADWTKGDALQMALRAQSNMDADLIFGVPTGSVDLETLMPPQDHAARARMLRPRSSSANWHGADGLAQWEIDRYNQRMNIGGPGFRLPSRPVNSSTASGGNAQDPRRSVLALGAAAAARQQQQQQQQNKHHLSSSQQHQQRQH